MFQKFRKVGPKKISKKYFLRKIFIEFPNKNIFSTHIFERKIAKISTFRDFFSLENVGWKIFLFGNSMKNFRRKYFSKKISDQLFEIFGTDHQALKFIFFGDSHEHQPASSWGPNSTSHAVRWFLLNNNTVAVQGFSGKLQKWEMRIPVEILLGSGSKYSILSFVSCIWENKLRIEKISNFSILRLPKFCLMKYLN